MRPLFNSRARVGGAHCFPLPEAQPSGGHKGGFKMPEANHWADNVQEGNMVPLLALSQSFTNSDKVILCLSCQALKRHLSLYLWHMHIFSCAILYCFLKMAIDKETMICSNSDTSVFTCIWLLLLNANNPPAGSASFLTSIKEYY